MYFPFRKFGGSQLGRQNERSPGRGAAWQQDDLQSWTRVFPWSSRAVDSVAGRWADGNDGAHAMGIHQGPETAKDFVE